MTSSGRNMGGDAADRDPNARREGGTLDSLNHGLRRPARGHDRLPRRAAGAIAAALCALVAASAAAVGLGSITQQSALGQSLRVVIPLIADGGEDLAAECFRLVPAAHDPDGIPQVQFARVVLEQAPSGARLVVVHPRPVHEPVLRLTVQAGCDAGVRREYTLLLDPPAIELPLATAETADGEPAARPAPSRAPPPASLPPPTRVAVAAADAALASDADAKREPRKAAPAKQRPPRASAARAPDASAQPRLKLAAPPPKPAPEAERGPSGAPGQAATQPAPTQQELADAIEAETVVLRQRIAELSATVERLQQELRAAEEADRAAALARKAAPPPPPPPPWWEANGPLLAAIVGLPVLLAGGLLWKRRREAAARGPDWRASTVMRPRAEAAAEPKKPRAQPAPGAKGDAGVAGAPAAVPPRRGPTRVPAAPGTVNALAVSELMHVTEEARVFVALGHVHRAIDVLRDHIKRAPTSMPAAWLMLLDLYHTNGDRQEFRHLAEDFHARFNVRTPLWDTFVAGGASDAGLEAFPHVILQIVALWRKPPCRAYLERLLYDNREGRRTGFPPGAYGDILLLLQISDAPPVIDIDSDLEKAGRLGPPRT